MNATTALLEQAVSQHRGGAVIAAIARYRQVLELEPSNPKALYYLAMALCHEGEFNEAIRALDRLLGCAPDDAAAHNLLGVAFQRLGRRDAALASFDRAISRQPDFAQAFGNRGNLLSEMRRNEEALESYNRAVSLDPQSAEDWSNRGAVLFELGRFGEAIASFDRAIGLRSEFAEAHVNRGNALRSLARYGEALADYDKAILLRPQSAEAHANRGVALSRLGRLKDAVASFNRALEVTSMLPAALLGRGDALLRLGRATEALNDFESAVATTPELAEGWTMRALALTELGRFEDALASSDQALARRGENAFDHLIRGVILYNLDRDAQALESLNRAAQLDSGNGRVFSERATVLNRLGEHEQALSDVDRALELAPDDPFVVATAGDVYLLHGRWEKGWKYYERRFEVEPKLIAGAARPAGAPSAEDGPAWSTGFGRRWDGERLQANETLLLVCEQGIGDSIQFSRFATELASLGHSVAVFAPPVVAPFLATVSGVRKVISDVASIGELGPVRSIPLLSLPAVLRLSLETVPARVPYLSVEPARIRAWADRIGIHGFRVGIAWQGNPEFRFDKGRSIALAEFAPLAVLSGVRLISLQMGSGTEQIAEVPFGNRVETIEHDRDLCDTAAILANLDLIITPDTMLAHLAGAMARPVHVALRANMIDWRWLLRREDSPWYPTARLFRQTVEGDWAPVFSRIADAVLQLQRCSEPD
jgi:tetratricopeptide (TPR) repeat protein